MPTQISTDVQELAGIETLMDMLEFRAAKTPDREAFWFNERSTDFADLWDQVCCVGTHLQNMGIGSGDRVMIVFPNGHEFFAAFYGIQLAGGISVPIYPGSGIKRALSIYTSCDAKAIIVPSDTPDELVETYQAAMKSFGGNLYRISDCLATSRAANFSKPDPDDIAFLQYTSGSTGNSKGVMLSHRNLLANLRQMVTAAEIDNDEVIVSWLPVYHDLGLILMTMAPFYTGARLILLPTTLTRISTWAETIHRFKATFTAAPDIGYRQLVRQVRDPSKYDLSTLRIAVNAAEPIRVKTVQTFEQMFNVPNFTKPCYGLAEACVGLSFWGLESRPIKSDDNGNVAIGNPLPGVEFKIVDGSEEVKLGEIGEIVFKSPSATRGYYRNSDATENLFWRDGFLRTGDLAYQDADGDIFMVAREKNIIKQSGRTIAPREIEELVEDFHEIRNCAAVGINRNDLAGEQAYVFAELRLAPENIKLGTADIARRIVREIHARLGFRPGRVYLVKKQTVPYTYNGKIRHNDLKNSYLDGTLAAQGRLIYPPVKVPEND